jgi:cyclopropane fatty-acyl-phospholipid synthase-like methyltransferase
MSRPQPAFHALAESGAIKGRVLDIGCGTGEHALMAAAMGLEATGIDNLPSAIETATANATARGLTARFLVHDALELTSLGEQFDTVLDCGLFHLFDNDSRVVYVDQLRSALPAGGRYFMLCLSDKQPGELGPRRVSETEIRSCFADGWQLDSVSPAEIATTTGPVGPQGAFAWLMSATRL